MEIEISWSIMFFFEKGIVNVSNYLKINGIMTLFSENFSKMDLSKKTKKVHALINDNKIEFIVKMACNDQDFYEICLLPEFSDIWVSYWNTYSFIITRDVNKLLYEPSESTNKFDLFMGMFFYNLALNIANKLKREYSACEIGYLIKSISFNSIHACQRYNSYLYDQMNINSDSMENTQKCFENIIIRIKKLLPAYRSYAYFMLTEAYIRYALYLREQNLPQNNQVFTAALEACNFAEKYYEDSFTCIFNASFGGSLADSNTLSLSDFDEVRQLIISIRDTGSSIPYDILEQNQNNAQSSPC